MNCPNCSHIFRHIRSATEGKDVALPGDLFLCPRCGLVSIVEASALGFKEGTLRPILETEFNALSDAEQADLNYAARNVIAKAKRDGFYKFHPSVEFITKFNERLRMKNI